MFSKRSRRGSVISRERILPWKRDWTSGTEGGTGIEADEEVVEVRVWSVEVVVDVVNDEIDFDTKG
jgi:hypothetical protein